MIAVVSDATVLIILAKKGRLDVLKMVFSQVLIPNTLMSEITVKSDFDPQVWNDPFFLTERASEEPLFQVLISILDPGESEALTLESKKGLPLLIDEKKGRSLAKNLGIPVIGLVGVLPAINRQSLLTAEAVIELLDEAQVLGFRLSEQLYREFIAVLK